MGILGCPKCGRTPVIYFVSTKLWVCKACRHEWSEKAAGEPAATAAPAPGPAARQAKPAVKKTRRAGSAKKTAARPKGSATRARAAAKAKKPAVRGKKAKR